MTDPVVPSTEPGKGQGQEWSLPLLPLQRPQASWQPCQPLAPGSHLRVATVCMASYSMRSPLAAHSGRGPGARSCRGPNIYHFYWILKPVPLRQDVLSEIGAPCACGLPLSLPHQAWILLILFLLFSYKDTDYRKSNLMPPLSESLRCVFHGCLVESGFKRDKEGEIISSLTGKGAKISLLHRVIILSCNLMSF